MRPFFFLAVYRGIPLVTTLHFQLYLPFDFGIPISRFTTYDHMRPTCILLSLFFLVVCSCKNNTSDLQTLDLLSQGLPLKILAPPDVEIVSSDLGIMKDVTVQNDLGFSIQIFESEAKKLDPKDIIDEIKDEINASKYFSKIVKEDADGFIFEKKVDEDYINYDFRHAKVRGDKQYVIQAGLSHQYTLEQVELMYESVQ